MPARRNTRNTRATNATRGRGGRNAAGPRRTTRPRVPTRFADGEIFPQPEPDGTPRVRTVSNTPEPDIHDEPMTPVPERVTGAHEANEANHDGLETPTAGVTAADLIRMEQRLLAHMQQATGAQFNNLTTAAGTAHGTSTPLPPRAETNSHVLVPLESSSSETDSLPEPLRHLFANTGIDAKTILDIAHNRFKALNLYRLLSTEREQSDSRGVASLNLDSMRVEQQRVWKEHDYRNEASFWRAWELYKAVFLATAPASLQSELATALAIYTANLWGLRSDYTWAGMKAYHFSFHRDMIASNAGRFDPSTWRTLDGNRVFATCVPAYLRAEAQHRDGSGRQPTRRALTGSGDLQERLYFPNTCRNFNNGKCTLPNCRWTHQCEYCGGDHGSFQCQQRDTGNSRPGWQRPSNLNRPGGRGSGRVGAA
jgi:hypothetical protein